MSDAELKARILELIEEVEQSHAAPIGQELRRLLFQDHVLTLTPRFSVEWAKVTCSACPLQVEGVTEKGQQFYFRARHDMWRIDLDDVTVLEGLDPMGLPLSYGASHEELVGFFEAQGVTVKEWRGGRE